MSIPSLRHFTAREIRPNLARTAALLGGEICANADHALETQKRLQAHTRAISLANKLI